MSTAVPAGPVGAGPFAVMPTVLQAMRIFLLVVLLALSHIPGGWRVSGSSANDLQHARQLLQSSSVDNIEIDSFEAFTRALEQAQNGSRLVLKLDTLELKQPLLITKAVTITGQSETKKTTVACTRGNSALVLRASGITLENLIVKDCSAPAVEIENPLPDDAPVAEFVLRQLEFYNNKVGAEFLPEGGALSIREQTNVTVVDSIFEDNNAAKGGAIYTYSADLKVERCTFKRNVASSSGGAIHAQANHLPFFVGQQDPFLVGQEDSRTLLITDSLFEDNSANPQGTGFGTETANGGEVETFISVFFQTPDFSGGAVFSLTHNVIVTTSTFKRNVASAGGALYLKESSNIEISECKFFEHSLKALVPVTEQGGAVYIYSVKDRFQAEIVNSTFADNSAFLGGGLHLLSMPKTSTRIVSCEFSNNTASHGGGAALVRNTKSVTWSQCSFSKNGGQTGGAVLLTNAAGSRFSDDCTFFNNFAADGGALCGLGAGIVELDSIHAKGNTAIRNGGALAMINSVPGAITSEGNGLYENNVAYRGGAMYFNGVIEMVIRGSAPTVIQSNRAAAGGAIYISAKNPQSNKFIISDAQFIQNNADEDMVLNEKKVESAMQQFGTNVLLEMMKDVTAMEETSPTACGLGGGGAICFGLDAAPERALVDVTISKSAFIENNATNGGGLYVNSLGGSWTPTCPPLETPLTYSRCRSFSVTGVNFTDNEVQGAGGAIFTNRPSNLYMSCEPLDIFSIPDKTLTDMESFCENWTGKLTDKKKGYGELVASSGAKLVLMSINGSVLNHTSGQALPQMKFLVRDEFGQVIKGGIPDAKMQISATSTVVKGQLDARARRGVATFDSLVASSSPGEYAVEFHSQGLEPVKVDFSIRQCHPGEEIVCPGAIECNWGNHTGCQRCEKEFYSFNPNISCISCPANAECLGGAAMIPTSGFWHSTPYSPQIHECLVEQACSYNDRQVELAKFFENSMELDVVAENPETYKQCRQGYSGVLCGSCDAGFGRFGRGECQKCKENRGSSIAIICALAFWAVVIVAVTIKSALNTARDLQDMRAVKALRRKDSSGGNVQPATPSRPSTTLRRPTPTPTPTPTPPQQSPPLPPSQPAHDQPQQNGTSQTSRSSQMTRVASISRAMSLMSEDSLSQLIANSPEELKEHLTPDIVNVEPNHASIDHITASEDMAEAVKILVNFLQVTSVAVAINVEWTNFIQRILEAQDMAAGFSNGSGVISIDCVLEDDPPIPRSILALIIRVSFPFMVLAVILLFFFLYWLYIRAKQNESVSYLKSRAVISGLCVLFFTYALVTKDLMRTVNCVEVDMEDLETLYKEFATATGKYWGEDTDLKCFKGEHAILAFAVGIPGLAVISFGAPVYLAWFLNKNKARHLERDFLNTYGFVYQAYKAKHVYWDAAIMVRKGLIGAVVVFAYTLGGNLQGVLALGILLLALVLHMFIQPFRNTKLNYLEAASLVVSALTFYSGIVFNDPNTSTEAEVVVSVVLFVIMILFVVAAIMQVYYNLDLYLLARLRHLKVEGVDASWGFWKKAVCLAHETLAPEENKKVVVDLSRKLTQRVGTMRKLLTSHISGESQASSLGSSSNSISTQGSVESRPTP